RRLRASSHTSQGEWSIGPDPGQRRLHPRRCRLSGADRRFSEFAPYGGAEMSDEFVRDRLPTPDRPYAGPVYEDASAPAATFPPIEPLQPPAGAPNVLIILLDDVGFR